MDVNVVYLSNTKPHNPYWKIYDLIKERQVKGKLVLDCGCGAGEHSIRLAEMGARVYAVDISKTAIEIAKQRAKKLGYSDKITFSVSSLENLPFDNEIFHFTFGIDILHHVDIKQTIPEIKRTLRTSGIAFFKEWKKFPIFERIRNSSLGLWLVSKHYDNIDNLDQHATSTERKLDKSDLLFINDTFTKCTFFYYYILSRFERFLPIPNITEKLMKIDYYFIRSIPISRFLSGEIIIEIQK